MAGGNRFLHVMIRVLDLNKSIEFYCQHLGLDLLRKKDFSEGRFTLAFLGYGDESDHTVIELTHNWDRTEPYPMGEAFGHLAIGVTDIYTICAELEQKGIEVPRKPGPMKGGKTVIAFVRDPDGYMIEFIER
ncbi:MAG: lactoylglutathione lyase [Emcibacter sp.]|nr:lactoylglutathione lyase [Emcibacter sp.]HEC01272.1 lactoylglutathione lyase [Sphingomonadales bacterium]